MKIKTICDVTGLTDRTIRYYIEQHLIAPAYTENYLGRKSFDFSEKDLCTLKSVSTLRKFDFTIDEIRQIIDDENRSNTIITNVRNRTEQAVSIGEGKLLALSQLSEDRTYTLDQLAEELSKPVIMLPVSKEQVPRKPGKAILSFMKSMLIFVIVWVPVALSLLIVLIGSRDYQYPVFDWLAICLTIWSLRHSVFVLIVSKIKWRGQRIVRLILLVLCILSIPISCFSSGGIIAKSETTDIRHYRRLDADCLVNRYSFYQDLFPTWPHYFVNEKQPDGSYETVYLDAHYLYRSLPAWDYTYDIYAQWPLEKEEFDKEVARVAALYETSATKYNHKFEVIERGNYTCFFLYHGSDPFAEVTSSYTYYIFAYDETNLTVRYIVCDSLEDGADQPYYLSLDW